MLPLRAILAGTLAAIALLLGLAAPSSAQTVTTISALPAGVEFTRPNATRFVIWGDSRRGLSYVPGTKEFLNTGKLFGRTGNHADSQDYRNAAITLAQRSGELGIRTVYIAVQDATDFGDFYVNAKIGDKPEIRLPATPTLAYEGYSRGNGKTYLLAVEMPRLVNQVTLSVHTRNESGGKKANGFAIRIAQVSPEPCPEQGATTVSAASSAKARVEKAGKRRDPQHVLQAKRERQVEARQERREGRRESKGRSDKRG